MGTDVAPLTFSRQDRSRYRQKLRRCLDALVDMLDGDAFDTDQTAMTGLEIELHLVDDAAEPAMRNAEVLAALGDPAFQPELGQFNLELNARPRSVSGDGLAAYQRDLTADLDRLAERAAKVDCHPVMIGILPTLTLAHTVPANFSANPRYHLLNEQILAARGIEIALDVPGPDGLRVSTDSIGPEAACTSVQCHLQLAPEAFAGHWNASQAVAAAQVAVGANSPFLFGRRLWDETRIPLFEQSTDTRPEELKAQGVRPRAWFGERWVGSVVELFRENLRYFPALLPICEAEDPLEVRRAGGVPGLAELRLHNGTIYRWNRPVYDVRGGRPHLRVENRVLPSGPTVPDLLANAAFYLGVTRELAAEEEPVWIALPFAAAAANFRAAARHGLAATVHWPGRGELPVAALVREELLPRAYRGLDRYQVAGPVRDRLLGIIEQRCRTGRTGAAWQTAAVAAEERRGRDRAGALQAMVGRYLAHQRTDQPVHEWPMD